MDKQTLENKYFGQCKRAHYKNLSVEYSFREFENWYKKEYEKIQQFGVSKDARVLRKDSKKPFTLDNLMLCNDVSKQKRVYTMWYNQNAACNDPKNVGYKHYGAKGVKINYTSNEFLEWCRKNVNDTRSKNFFVRRKDKTKDFTLDNLHVVYKRTMENIPPNDMGYKVNAIDNNGNIKTFSSMKKCQRFLNCSSNKLKYAIKNKNTVNGYRVELA